MNNLVAGGRMRRDAGFTLIELMVAVVIVGILAAVAIPNYTQYVKKGRRVDAKSALLDLAGREERYFAIQNKYTTDALTLGYTSASITTATTVTIGTGYYKMTLTYTTSGATTDWTATAVPTTVGGQSTDACGTYILNSLGAQTNVLVTANTTGCW